MPNIDQFQARSGRLIKEDGTVVNEANGINADGSRNVLLSGSNAMDAAAVVPNDGADLAKGTTKGLYLGVSGDVKITLSSGSIVAFKGLSSGVIHPIAVKRVHATGTTATDILAVY
jgi:hypothetical protein